MATAAQIAANRRNARKSTGPKTAHGKKASSRNAVKHGLTTPVSQEEVRRFAEIIRSDYPSSRLAKDDPRSTLRLLQLAEAEVRLERARQAERETLAKGDDDLRLVREVDLIFDMLSEEQEVWKRLTEAEVQKGAAIGFRLGRAGQANARRTYASLRRYLREAEADHAEVLRAWIEGL